MTVDTKSAGTRVTYPRGLLVSFEVAFRNACEAVGWTVDEPGSATQRFVDMTVQTNDGEARKLSLKSTAAQRMSETTAHISKLTEAAWIQDVRSARIRRDHTLDLFHQYRSAVDAIIMLRAFRPDRSAAPTKYQLLEVPTIYADDASDYHTLDTSIETHLRDPQEILEN